MADPRVGQLLDGRYRILEKLAAGGMGVVYRGERVGLGKAVAIKFLHRTTAMVQGNRVRFEREAAAMSRLTHPNLVTITDFGQSEGLPYLVMDYHPGIPLAAALVEGPLEPRRAVFVARQMLAGLHSAHAAGVVHRDLKPGNVLLCGEPGEDLVKILDFGVAKLLDAGLGPTEVSVVAGHTLGTPAYMSPEHAKGEAVDARADVYATGIMLYEMLAGRRPFQAEGKLGILRKQVEEQAPRLRDAARGVSYQLEAAIEKAMEKSPAARWQSAAEFAAALAAVPEGRTGRQLSMTTPAPSRAPSAPAPAAPRVHRKSLAVRAARAFFIGVLLSAIGFFAVLILQQSGVIDIPMEWLTWIPWSDWDHL
ncbi:MAG TPA: serine/threonine-protein kinase [Kofleriaceae bacterium]|nr:serine/threonine-protein kinase [Kofleriaceae bacterium]